MVAAPTAEVVDALAESVWPRHCSRGADGAMTIGGVDVRDIAADHGSPVYVLDEVDLRSRAREYASAYRQAGASRVYYAAKAFFLSL